MIDRRLSWATLTVVGGMFLGRLTGLARELAVAAQFGVSREADLAALAITIPELLNTIFLGGAVSAVLIPEFHRLQRDSTVAANRLVAQFSFVVAAVSLVVALALAVGSSSLATILAPGFESRDHEMARIVIRIVLVALPLCTLAAVSSAVLQARQAVGLPAFGTLLFNGVLIAGMLLGARSAAALSWLVVLAALVRWLPQYGLTRRLAKRETCSPLASAQPLLPAPGSVPAWRLDLLTREHARRYVHTIAAVATSICLPHLARAFASHTEGGIALFNYAWKLFELPSGLIVVVLSMVIFPRLSRLAQSGEHPATAALASRITSLLLLGLVPVTVGAVSAAGLIARLVFGHGWMSPDQLRTIEELTRITLLALPATVLTMHAMGVCQAHGDTQFPFRVSLGVLLVFLPAAGLAERVLGLTGVMAAMVAIQWIQAALMIWGVSRHHGIRLLETLSSPRLLGLAGGTALLLLLGWRFSQPAASWWLPFLTATSLSLLGAGLTFTLLPDMRRLLWSRLRHRVAHRATHQAIPAGGETLAPASPSGEAAVERFSRAA